MYMNSHLMRNDQTNIPNNTKIFVRKRKQFIRYQLDYVKICIYSDTKFE